MPFSPFFINEIRQITALDTYSTAYFRAPTPRILIDFKNALGHDDLVPVYEEGRPTRLSRRHIRLMRCLNVLSAEEITQFIRQGGVTAEAEDRLCNAFVAAWIQARGPLNFLFKGRYTPLGLAIHYGMLDHIEFLIAAGAEFNGKYRYSRSRRSYVASHTIMQIAFANAEIETAEYLIGMGYRIPARIRQQVMQRAAVFDNDPVARMKLELIAWADYCNRIAIHLVSSKVARGLIATDEDIILEAISDHFRELFYCRTELLEYRELVGEETYNLLLTDLITTPEDEIGDYIEAQLRMARAARIFGFQPVAAIAMPVVPEQVVADPQPPTPPPSPTPATPCPSPAPSWGLDGADFVAAPLLWSWSASGRSVSEGTVPQDTNSPRPPV